MRNNLYNQKREEKKIYIYTYIWAYTLQGIDFRGTIQQEMYVISGEGG